MSTSLLPHMIHCCGAQGEVYKKVFCTGSAAYPALKCASHGVPKKKRGEEVLEMEVVAVIRGDN